MNEWISVKKQLPEAFETVIAYCDNADMIFGFMTSDGYWVELGSEIPYTVTHWMSVPEPPKEV